MKNRLFECVFVKYITIIYHGCKNGEAAGVGKKIKLRVEGVNLVKSYMFYSGLKADL